MINSFYLYVKLVLAYLFLLFFISCNSTIQEQSTSTVKIKLDDIDEVKFDDLLPRYSKQVQLESRKDILIGDDLQFYFYSENIYVLDKSQKKLLRFQDNGNFINEVGKVGRGPNELPNISSFFVDKHGVTSISSVGLTTKIFNFSHEGVLRYSKTLKDFIAIDIEMFNSCYQFYTGYNKTIHSYRIIQLDTNLVKRGEYLKNDYSGQLIPVREKNFFRGNGGLFLKESLNPIIYEITDNNLKPIYEFDFGEYAIPADYWDMDGIKGFQFIFKKGVAIIRDFFQNNQFAFFVVIFQKDKSKSKIHYVIYDKISGQFKKAVVKDNSEAFNFTNPIGITKENEILLLGFPALEESMDQGDLDIKNPAIRYYNLSL